MRGIVLTLSPSSILRWCGAIEHRIMLIDLRIEGGIPVVSIYPLPLPHPEWFELMFPDRSENEIALASSP